MDWVHRKVLTRGSGVLIIGCTSCGRCRGSDVNHCESEAYGVLLGGLEGQAEFCGVGLE